MSGVTEINDWTCHELYVLTLTPLEIGFWIILQHERQDSFQPERLHEPEVLLHWEARSIDT